MFVKKIAILSQELLVCCVHTHSPNCHHYQNVPPCMTSGPLCHSCWRVVNMMLYFLEVLVVLSEAVVFPLENS